MKMSDLANAVATWIAILSGLLHSSLPSAAGPSLSTPTIQVPILKRDSLTPSISNEAAHQPNFQEINGQYRARTRSAAMPSIPLAVMRSAESREDLIAQRIHWREYCKWLGIESLIDSATMLLTLSLPKATFNKARQTITYSVDDEPSLPESFGELGTCASALLRIERALGDIPHRPEIRARTTEGGHIEISTNQPRRGQPSFDPGPSVVPLKEWKPGASSDVCIPVLRTRTHWLNRPIRAGFDSSGNPVYNYVWAPARMVEDDYSHCR